MTREATIVLAGLGLVVGALALQGMVGAAQTTTRWVERTKADVRAGRGSYHEVVDTVLKGERIQIMRNEERWLLVQTPRAKTGWIFEAALSVQPVSPGSSDFLRNVPGDASTSATAASTGAKGVYAQGYARAKGYDYEAVTWLEENQPAGAEVGPFVRAGGLRAPEGEP